MTELTDDERRKFIAYCYAALAKEAAKLSGDELSRKRAVMSMPMLRKAVAFAVVALHLESVEIVTIETKP